MSKKLILPTLEKETLEELFRNHAKAHLRARAQCILLFAKGFKVPELAKMYSTRKHTIYDWIKRYEATGFIGLMIRPGRGLKAKMNSLEPDQIEIIKAEITLNPQSLREVSAILSEKFGFEITKLMLKKYLKKN
jgi:transposase